MWCSLWALAAAQKHALAAGADDSAVQPLLSALVEPVVPPDAVPNAVPALEPVTMLIDLKPEPMTNTAKGEIPIRLLLYVCLGGTRTAPPPGAPVGTL